MDAIDEADRSFTDAVIANDVDTQSFVDEQESDDLSPVGSLDTDVQTATTPGSVFSFSETEETLGAQVLSVGGDTSADEDEGPSTAAFGVDGAGVDTGFDDLFVDDPNFNTIADPAAQSGEAVDGIEGTAEQATADDTADCPQEMAAAAAAASDEAIGPASGEEAATDQATKGDASVTPLADEDIASADDTATTTGTTADPVADMAAMMLEGAPDCPDAAAAMMLAIADVDEDWEEPLDTSDDYL